MEDRKKQCIGLTGGLAAIGVALLVTAFATDNWVSSSPVGPAENVSNIETAGTGNSTFGLFNGRQILNYGSGSRDYELKVTCEASESVCAYIFMRSAVDAEGKVKILIKEYKNNSLGADVERINYGLFSFPMWLCVIIFLSLSIVMGLVTIGFSVFNIFGRPIETITGPMGLYLWNSLTLLFTVLTLALFGALFGLELSENFLMYDDVKIGWKSKGYTNLGYSFFLVVGTAGALLLNFLLLSLSGQDLACSYSRSGEKEIDNGMILY